MDAQARFRILAVAAVIDGEVANSEKAFLDQMAQDLGIAEDRADRILKEAAKTKTISVPQELKDADDIINDIIRLILVDDRVSLPEKRYLRAIGEALNIPERRLRILIAQTVMKARRDPEPLSASEIAAKKEAEMEALKAQLPIERAGTRNRFKAFVDTTVGLSLLLFFCALPIKRLIDIATDNFHLNEDEFSLICVSPLPIVFSLWILYSSLRSLFVEWTLGPVEFTVRPGWTYSGSAVSCTVCFTPKKDAVLAFARAKLIRGEHTAESYNKTIERSAWAANGQNIAVEAGRKESLDIVVDIPEHVYTDPGETDWLISVELSLVGSVEWVEEVSLPIFKAPEKKNSADSDRVNGSPETHVD
jgi:hypothetical protein